MSRALPVLIVATLFTLGCGDDGPVVVPDGSADGGVDAGDGGFVPAAPALPAAVNAGPCPDGWRERAVGDEGVACEPYAGEAPLDCGPFEAHFPGAVACEPVGGPCPTGEFPDVPAGTTAIYVSEGATGGDGTLAAPYGTVAEAALAAGSGTVIVLGRGAFSAEVTLRGGVELWGACAAETVLTSTFAVERAGVFNVTSSGVVIKNVRIEGAARAGLLVDGGSVRVEGVIIDDNAVAGVRVIGGGDLVIDESIIRNSRPSATSPRTGGGIVVGAGTLRAHRVSVDDNRGQGISASGGGTTVVITDSIVRGSRAPGVTAVDDAEVTIERTYLSGNSTVAAVSASGGNLVGTHLVARGNDGWGFAAQLGGTVSIFKSLVESSDESGARADIEGSHLTLEDVAVLDMRAEFSPQGRGVEAVEGGAVTVRRLHVEGAIDNSLFVVGAGSRLVAEDVRASETQVRPSDLIHGRGLTVEDGGRVEITRLWIDRSKEAALVALGEGTLLFAEDVTITNTLPRDADERFGRGLVVEYGAAALVRRALIADNLDAAVFVGQPNTSLLLEDAVIRDTSPERSSNTRGRGFEVGLGASMTATRVEVQRSREVGFLLSNDASLSFEDLRILDTSGDAAGGYGRALTVQARSTMDGRGLTVERCAEVGFMAAGAGTVVHVSDVAIRDVVNVVCDGRPGCDGSLGNGIGVYDGAEVAVNDFVVERAETCGVHVDSAGLDLMGGEVSACTIGVCVGTPGFDLTRLQNDVRYTNNGTNLDTTSLPVPATFGSAME